mgnify:CR=1 FL=1
MKTTPNQFLETYTDIGHAIAHFIDLRTISDVFVYPNEIAVIFKKNETVYPMLGDFQNMLKVGLINFRIDSDSIVLYFKH